MFRSMRPCLFAVSICICPAAAWAAQEAPPQADHVYRNAVVFTADSGNSMASAVAVREGRIVYVGSDQGVSAFVGPRTAIEDLKGHFMMPGLVDGHMHPLEGGSSLLKCNLNYESLTIARFQQRIQACLDRSRNEGPDAWLEVVSWFQESMRPAGVRTSHATLDSLHTTRPILVRSSFGHTALVNARGIALGHISASTPDPVGGKIWHEANGEPTGLFEDAAYAVFDALLPKATAEQQAQAALAALKAMNQQGVTSFLDAVAPDDDLQAFLAASSAGKLTARAHFAPLIEPSEAQALDVAVARVLAFRKTYDQGPISRRPSLTVRNAKLFLDGVISAPAMTGAVLEPYRRNAGNALHAHWVAGTDRGPAVYFSTDTLERALTALGRAGIDPHLHADGDGAVRAALDGVAALRKALPGEDIRPGIAHCEIVSPEDLPRFKALGAIPVLSFQWQKPGGDTLGLTDYFGPERMQRLEPGGRLAGAGARVAFGSDWPVDALDEWFAFKVGVTRTNTPDAPAKYRGRLGTDPGLSRLEVLRAATINAAYELHQDDSTGSLEAGKFADLIVLDRNPLTVSPDQMARTRVLQTVLGGNVVYEAEQGTAKGH